MWWSAMSLNGWISMFPIPVKGDRAVCKVRLWHRAHPMASNKADPRAADGLIDVGVGGADSRMKAAKLTVSEGLVVPPAPMLLESSGVGLKTQPGTADRSLGKSSLDTPCSTL